MLAAMDAELKEKEDTIRELTDEVAALEAERKKLKTCLLYTSPSPRDKRQSRMPSSA